MVFIFVLLEHLLLLFHNRKGAGEAELLIAGRVFVLFLVVISIIWDVQNDL